MITGLELVAGFLIAWAARKAQRVGQKADQLVDTAIDASFERLRQVVVDKLAEDPSLKQLEQDAANGVEVSARTRQRVTLAIEEAAEDGRFATELAAAIKEVQGAQAAATVQQPHVDTQNSTIYGNQVNTAGVVTKGNIISAVTGSITIDQSERKRDACFCGLEVRAHCPGCGDWVCGTHFIEAGKALDYSTFEMLAERVVDNGLRNNVSYRHFTVKGSNGCILCRIKDADRLMDERISGLREWLQSPSTLAFDQFEYLGDLVGVMTTQTATTVLRHSFHLFQTTMKIVRLEAEGQLSPGEAAIPLGRNTFAPEYFVSKSGHTYAKSVREHASDHTSLSIAVSPWETPKISRNSSGVRFGMTSGGSRFSTEIIVEPSTDLVTAFYYLRTSAERKPR